MIYKSNPVLDIARFLNDPVNFQLSDDILDIENFATIVSDLKKQKLFVPFYALIAGKNEAIRNTYAQEIADIKEDKEIRWHELQRISGFFQQQNIAFAMIKGAALSVIIYGNHWMREYGDIDILVSEEDLLTADKIMVANGYTRVNDYKLDQTLDQAYMKEPTSHEMFPYVKDVEGITVFIEIGKSLHNIPAQKVTQMLHHTVLIENTSIPTLDRKNTFLQIVDNTFENSCTPFGHIAGIFHLGDYLDLMLYIKNNNFACNELNLISGSENFDEISTCVFDKLYSIFPTETIPLSLIENGNTTLLQKENALTTSEQINNPSNERYRFICSWKKDVYSLENTYFLSPILSEKTETFFFKGNQLLRYAIGCRGKELILTISFPQSLFENMHRLLFLIKIANNNLYSSVYSNNIIFFQKDNEFFYSIKDGTSDDWHERYGDYWDFRQSIAFQQNSNGEYHFEIVCSCKRFEFVPSRLVGCGVEVREKQAENIYYTNYKNYDYPNISDFPLFFNI